MKHVSNRLLLALTLSIAGLASACAHSGQPVQLVREGNVIHVRIGGRPFTTYYFGPEAPKPYLHPLRSAAGTVVTRGFPMRTDIPGESTDHPHQRAMFYAHGDINGIDFWGEGESTKAQETANGVYYPGKDLPNGRTVFVSLEMMQGGPEAGEVKALFHVIGPDGNLMGDEIQAYVFRGDADTRSIDCEFTIQAHDQALKMGDTKEGTFAIRLVKGLETPAVHMLNSEGGTDEQGIWGKRARWVDYSGTVESEQLGIAVFDNPRNPKYPTYWHARGYGLLAANPFGEHDFYDDKNRDGSLTIPAGQKLTFRYSVLIHHGDARQANLTKAYAQYLSSQE